jgi:hypothetical protein
MPFAVDPVSAGVLPSPTGLSARLKLNGTSSPVMSIGAPDALSLNWIEVAQSD